MPNIRVRDAGEVPLESDVVEVGVVFALLTLSGGAVSSAVVSSSVESELVEVSANLTVVLRVDVGLIVDPNFKIAALCSMDKESHAFCSSGERDFHSSEDKRADLV